MANLSNTTRDHEEIRRWAEERGGKPAHVKNTGSAEDIGILRIDFPGYSGEGSLEPISWEDFFRKFDERGLALVYQEETAGGQKSNFNKLVSAGTAEERGGAGGNARPGATKSRSGGRKRSGAGTRSAGKKGAAPKKAAASTSTRSSARPKKATGKKVSSKNASRQTRGAKKTSRKTASKAAAGKKSAAKKGSGKKPSSRSGAKKSAARRRR
jgi:hypothetical protein